VPNAVWSVKTRITDEHDRFIVLSFKDATMVLSIGETVEEIHDSGFLGVCYYLIIFIFFRLLFLLIFRVQELFMHLSLEKIHSFKYILMVFVIY
jgi:hypothetical protein